MCVCALILLRGLVASTCSSYMCTCCVFVLRHVSSSVDYVGDISLRSQRNQNMHYGHIFYNGDSGLFAMSLTIAQVAWYRCCSLSYAIRENRSHARRKKIRKIRILYQWKAKSSQYFQRSQRDALKPWPNGNASGRKLNMHTNLCWVAKRTRKCTQIVQKAISLQLCAQQFSTSTWSKQQGLRWLALGGQTVKNLRWPAFKFDLEQRERKSSQVNASAHMS